VEKPQKMMSGKPFIASGLWTSADISAGSVVINHSEKEALEIHCFETGVLFYPFQDRGCGAGVHPYRGFLRLKENSSTRNNPVT